MQQQKRSILITTPLTIDVNLIKYSELSSNRIDENYYWAQQFLAFFGDKIAILTMKMIFYKQLAITVGIHLVKRNLWQKK